MAELEDPKPDQGLEDWLKKNPSPQEQPKIEPAYKSGEPLGDWLERSKPKDDGGLTLAVNQGVAIEPERAARVLRAQLETGYDPGYIDRNLKDVEEQSKKYGKDLPKLLAYTPLTAKYLAENPNRVGLFLNDIPHLVDLERRFSNERSHVLNRRPDEKLMEEATEMTQEELPSLWEQQQNLFKTDQFGLSVVPPEAFAQPRYNTKEEMAQALTDRNFARLKKKEDFISNEKPLGAGELAKHHVEENPIEILPYFGHLGGVMSKVNPIAAANRYEAGNPTKADIRFLKEFGRVQLAIETRGKDVPAGLTETAFTIVPFGLEVATSLGVSAFGRKLVLGGVEEASAGLLRRVLSRIVGTTIQLPVAGLTAIPDIAAGRMMGKPSLSVGPDGNFKLDVLKGEGPGEALAKATFERWADQLAAELVGMKFAKGMTVPALKQKIATEGLKEIGKFMGMGELASAIKSVPFGKARIQDWQVPVIIRALEGDRAAIREMIVTSIAGFGMGAGGAALHNMGVSSAERLAAKQVDIQGTADFIFNYRDMMKDAAEKVKGMEADKKAPEVVQQALGRIIGPENKYTNLNPEQFLQVYEKKGVDPHAFASELTGKPEALEEALSKPGHLLKIPTEAYLAKIGKTPEGALFQDHIVPDAMKEDASAMERHLKEVDAEIQAEKKAKEEAKKATEEAKAAKTAPEAELAAKKVRLQQIDEQLARSKATPGTETDEYVAKLTEKREALSSDIATTEQAQQAEQHAASMEEKIAAQAEAAGRPKEEAGFVSKIMGTFYRAMGMRSKQTPEALFKKYPVQLQKGEQGIDQGLQQPAPTDFGEREQPLSSRLPTGVTATEDPLHNVLKIGHEEMKLSPKAYEKNVDVVRGYSNLRPDEAKGAPEKVAEKFIDHLADNLLWLHDQTPKAIRDRAKLWYDGANKLANRWAEKYKMLPRQISGVLAALSPQKDWYENVSLAERVLDIVTQKRDFRWTNEMTQKAKQLFHAWEAERLKTSMSAETLAQKAKYDADMLADAKGKKLSELSVEGNEAAKALWVRVYDEVYNSRAHRLLSPEGDFKETVQGAKGPAKVAWPGLQSVAKAISIAENGSRENISNELGKMHKVRNFYNNILDPGSEHGFVTIDTHAVNAGLLKPRSGNSDEVSHNFGGSGTGEDSVHGVMGLYGLYADAYRKAAEKRGILPREMQSITWESVRSLFNADFKSNPDNLAKIDAIWQDYNSKRISLNEARNQILKVTSGIKAPEWTRPDSAVAGSAWASSYTGELLGGGVPGWGTGPFPRRAGADASGADQAEGVRGFFQGENAPPFFSKLQKTIQEKLPASAPVDQVRGVVKDLKPEELKYSGIADFLKGKEKVSKQELLDYLRMHDLDLKEIVKGQPRDPSEMTWREIPTYSESQSKTFDFSTPEWKARVTQDKTTGNWDVETYKWRPQSERWEIDPKEFTPVPTLEAAQKKAEKSYRTWEKTNAVTDPTRHDQYQLKGGREYREFLITYKPREPEVNFPSYEEWLKEKIGPEQQTPELDAMNRRVYLSQKLSATDKARAAHGTFSVGAHWSEKNVVAHVRFNERTDAEGNRVLFLEELQSDWHQQGRELGYKGNVDTSKLKVVREPQEPTNSFLVEKTREGQFAVFDGLERFHGVFVTEAAADAHANKLTEASRRETVKVVDANGETLESYYSRTPGEVTDERAITEAGNKLERDALPDAPFKKNWHEFVLKRMIRYAAENGFDKIAWTSGLQQAERWRMSSHIEGLRVEAGENIEGKTLYRLEVRKPGEKTWTQVQASVPEERLPEYIGRELAQKVLSKEGKKAEYRVLSGDEYNKLLNREEPNQEYADRYPWVILDESNTLEDRYASKEFAEAEAKTKTERLSLIQTFSGMDLHIGGEGMKYFYDKMLPDFANKFGGKFESKVEPLPLVIPDPKTDLYTGPSLNYDEMKAFTKKLKKSELKDAATAVMLQMKDGFRLEHAMQQKGTPELAEKLGGSMTRSTKEVHSMDITPKLREAALQHGFSMFQPGTEGYQGEYIPANITEEPGIINYFEGKANPSTSLHEPAHHFLDVMGKMALQPEVEEFESGHNQTIRQDFQTFLDWRGIKDPETWAKMSLNDQRPHHEAWAHAYEQWYWEGKAPSQELRPVFQRFRAWLSEIYDRMVGKGIEVPEQIRGIFERMHATDAEIQRANERMGRLEPFLEDLDFVKPADREKFAELRAQKDAAATERLDKEANADLKEQQTKQWQHARDMMREDVEREFNETKEAKAISYFKNWKKPDGSPLDEGTPLFKLSRAEVQKLYPDMDLKSIPFGMLDSHFKEDSGISPDLAADMFKFNSGKELVDTLINTDPAVSISRETDARMAAQVVDPMETLPEEARKAIHNAEQQKLNLYGLEWLVRNKLPQYLNLLDKISDPVKYMKDVRAVADKKIATTTYNERDLRDYERGELDARKAARAAAKKSDFPAAFGFKTREILNAEYYRSAVDAKEAAESAAALLARLTKKEVKQQLGKAGGDLLDIAQSFNDRFSFTNEPSSKGESRKLLADYIIEKAKSGEDLGEQLSPPSWMLNEAFRMNWKDLPHSYLMELRDTATQILKEAQAANKMISLTKAMDFDGVVKELVDQGKATHAELPLEPSRTARTLGDKLKKIIRSGDAAMVKMEQLVKELDGGKIDGPWHRYVFFGAADAQTREMDMGKPLHEALVELSQNLPKEIKDHMADRISLPGRRRITRWDTLGFAAQSGNSGNWRKFLEGEQMRKGGFTEEEIFKFVGDLKKEEKDLVQAYWDTMESPWPEVAKLYKELTGLEPEKVEVGPQHPAFIGYRGGYAPIIYEASKSRAGEMQRTAMIGDLDTPGYRSATMANGYTQKRTGYVAPMDTDLLNLPAHMDVVIKDLTHRKWMLDMNKILNNEKITAFLTDHLGKEYYDRFREWVKQTVNERNQASLQSLSVFKRFLNSTRLAMASVGTGFKAATLLHHVTSIEAAIGDLGPTWVAKGYMKMRTPFDSYKEMVEESGEMRHFWESWDRDQQAIFRMTAGKSDPISVAQRAASDAIGLANTSRAIPIYFAGKWKALEELPEKYVGEEREKLAIRAGEEAVRLNVGAGAAKDRAAIMSSGSEFMKVFTTYFTPGSILYNRFHDIKAEFKREGNIPRLVNRLLWTWVVAALSQKVITGHFPNKKKDEGWGWWAVKNEFLYPLESVPMMRDLVDAAVTGHPPASKNPIVRDAEALVSMRSSVIKAVHGELSAPRAVEDVARAANMFIGLPIDQVFITGDYIHDLTTGESNPNDIFEFWSNVLHYHRHR